MNKNLKAGLIVGGVAIGLLAIAFVANVAGLTTNFAGMPYRQQMQGAFGAWQGGMMRGNYSGMMGSNYGANMMGGNYGTGMMGQNGGMMDFDNMPHRNWTSSDGQAPWENCPYFNQAQ
jgi:hypothetical protein